MHRSTTRGSTEGNARLVDDTEGEEPAKVQEHQQENDSSQYHRPGPLHGVRILLTSDAGPIDSCLHITPYSTR